MKSVVAVTVLALLAVACSPGAAPESTQTDPTSTSTTGTATIGPTTQPTTSSTSTAATSQPGLTCWTAATSGQPGPIEFTDATSEFGLVEPLLGIHGHAAAFGDVDGDMKPDLLVGTFGNRPVEAYQERGAQGPRTDQLLRSGDAYESVEPLATELGRTSGAVFADLDGDGDDDLLLVRHAGLRQQSAVPSQIYENDGGQLVAKGNPLATGFLGRTPAIADFDGDRLLDLYVSEDKYGDRGGVLMRNLGNMEFEDVTDGSGLEGALALGATAADLNDDGRPDLVTSRQVFENLAGMEFRDVTPLGYVEEPLGDEDDPAGVAVGDVNRDAIADIVLGQHNRLTVARDVSEPVRLFLGIGADAGGAPGFEEVTEAAGLVPLPTLAPHVAIADIDNDGWPDIVTTASADSGELIAIFRNAGEEPVRFEMPDGLGSDQYWVGGPLADINQDGKLDVFALEWEPALPSLMFNNTGATGHWLEVTLSGPGGGVGSVVTVTSPAGELIGVQELAVGGGYSSGQMPVAHFGLGAITEVNVEIQLAGRESVLIEAVPADQHIRWPSGCG